MFSFIKTIIKSLYCFRGDQAWPSNGFHTPVFQTLSALVIYHRFYWRLLPLLNITLLPVCMIQSRYLNCSVWVSGLRTVLFPPIISSITILFLQFSNVDKLDEQCQRELPKGISTSLKLCSQSQGWYFTGLNTKINSSISFQSPLIIILLKDLHKKKNLIF